jgi:hypothetical protein
MDTCAAHNVIKCCLGILENWHRKEEALRKKEVEVKLDLKWLWAPLGTGKATGILPVLVLLPSSS